MMTNQGQYSRGLIVHQLTVMTSSRILTGWAFPPQSSLGPQLQGVITIYSGSCFTVRKWFSVSAMWCPLAANNVLLCHLPPLHCLELPAAPLQGSPRASHWGWGLWVEFSVIGLLVGLTGSGPGLWVWGTAVHYCHLTKGVLKVVRFTAHWPSGALFCSAIVIQNVCLTDGLHMKLCEVLMRRKVWLLWFMCFHSW